MYVVGVGLVKSIQGLHMTKQWDTFCPLLMSVSEAFSTPFSL